MDGVDSLLFYWLKLVPVSTPKLNPLAFLFSSYASRSPAEEKKMEGVGARLGRSSTRYGPATVFTGPVRRWKKEWVPLLSSNPSSNHGANSNSNGRSHLLVYKWTPIPASGNGNGSATAAVTPAKDGAAAAAQIEEPPRKKFRYVPISVIEEQKQDAAAKHEEESKFIDRDQSLQNKRSDMKPDINDIPMDETQVSEKDQAALAKGKGTNLDLSLGLNSEGGKENEHRASRKGESGSSKHEKELRNAANSHFENKLKRKAVAPDLEMRV